MGWGPHKRSCHQRIPEGKHCQGEWQQEQVRLAALTLPSRCPCQTLWEWPLLHQTKGDEWSTKGGHAVFNQCTPWERQKMNEAEFLQGLIRNHVQWGNLPIWWGQVVNRPTTQPAATGLDYLVFYHPVYTQQILTSSHSPKVVEGWHTYCTSWQLAGGHKLAGRQVLQEPSEKASHKYLAASSQSSCLAEYANIVRASQLRQGA